MPSPATAPRPELVALLRHAAENPDDPAACLVVADWLEENGDKKDQLRAELIRVECELQGPDVAPNRWSRLDRRNDQLRMHTASPVTPFLAAGLKGYTDRGMVNVTFTAKQFLDPVAAALMRTEAWAWVAEVGVGVSPGLAARIAD